MPIHRVTSPSAEQRRSVIELAKTVDEQAKWLTSLPDYRLAKCDGPLYHLKRDLTAKRQRLAEQSAAGLDDTKPPLTVRQASINAAVVAAGAFSRTGAVAVAGAVAAPLVAMYKGPTACMIPMSPFFAAEAALKEWHKDPPEDDPGRSKLRKTTIAGAIALGQYATAPVWLPLYLSFERGACAREKFEALDRFSQALAYVKRSTSSTQAIADKTARKMTRTLERVEKKMEKFPESKYGPVPMKRVPGTRAQDGMCHYTIEVDSEKLREERNRVDANYRSRSS